jgi:hypothetical protein
MSTRKAIVHALRDALAAASPDVRVHYMRDVRATREAQIDVTDGLAKISRQGSQHQHEVRVTVTSQIVGDDIGDLLCDEIERLIPVIGQPTTFSGIPGFVSVVLDATGNDPVGDGMETGVVTILLTVTYRVNAWSGA